MNINPFLSQVLSAIEETQDGRKLTYSDQYSEFLLTLISNNTENGNVNTEELESNLRYAIFEFNKALHAVKKFNTSLLNY